MFKFYYFEGDVVMSLPLGQEPSNTDGQVPTDPTPAPVTPPVVPPVTPPATGQEPVQRFDAAYVADLRKSEAATRKRASELEARLQAIEDANKSDLERAQARAESQAAKAAGLEVQLAAEQGRYRDALIQAAVEREAVRQHAAISPDKIYALVDRAGLAIDEAGTVTGAEKVVKALLEAEPHLQAPTQTAGITAIPVTPRATGKPQTQAEMVAAAEARLAQSGRYSRL